MSKPKAKPVKKVAKKMKSKKPSRTAKKTSVSLLQRFQRLSKRAQILVFGIVFAVIGGGYYLYQSSASDGLPSKANQLVISYEVGMSHIVPEDTFTTGKGNINLLLYGNGLLLCSAADAHAGMDHATSEQPAWNYRQLTRDQVHALVDNVKAAGFDKAASYRDAPNGYLPPASAASFIRLNTSEGVTEAVTYPTSLDTGFSKVEAVLKAECAKTTTSYEPEDVVAETVTLPSDHPDAAQAKTELPANVDVDPTAKGRGGKELKGNDAKAIKSKLSRTPKVYKQGSNIVRARYVDRIPDWEAFKVKKANSNGKVMAAGDVKTRWLLVLAAGQTKPDWVTTAAINDDAANVRNWYAGKTGKNFDVASAQVVRSSKSVAQLKVCPAGANCRASSEAVYYNLYNEFHASGYSTIIVTAFRFHDSAAWGWGTQDTLDGYFTKHGGTLGISDGTLTQKQRRQTAAHEFGHNAGLSHTCDGTLMWAGGSCPLYAEWQATRLNGSQAAALSASSPFFNATPPPPPPAYSQFFIHAATAYALPVPNCNLQTGGRQDLTCVATSNTGTGKIEVHRLTAGSGYQLYDVHSGTAFSQTTTNCTWLMAANGDLYCIMTSGTASGKIEVHRLTAASGYQTFDIRAATALVAGEGSNGTFHISGNNDLYFVKNKNTSGTVEVHRLSIASGYKSFTMQARTAFPSPTDNCKFQIVGVDLFCIMTYATGSGKIEMHALRGQ
jgi:hypothetical protein